MITIDRLSYQSKLRYVNTGEKFIFSISALCFCIGTRSIILALFVLFIMGIFTVLKGGIPFIQYLRLMTIPLVFLLLNVCILGLSIRKTPLEVFSISFGSWYLTASYDTLHYAIQIFITALASVSCLYFLSCNTTMTDILTLLKKIHCPSLIIELMLLIYRFIFVLLECANAITISQHSRLGNKDYKTSLSSFGMLVSNLFIRTIKRSNSLFDAMESRCYNGTIAVISEEYPPKRKEVIGLILFELLLLFLAVITRY